MARVPFETLPDESRLWVFGVGRHLDAAEEEAFLTRVDGFLDSWAAHGVELTCARDWRHGRFLLVAVDEASEPPSGCSIDAMVCVLKNEEVLLETSIVDSAPVWFLDEGRVQRTSRADFKRSAEAGEVGPDTVVFDNTLTRVAEERRGGWQRLARESWHGRAFFAGVS